METMKVEIIAVGVTKEGADVQIGETLELDIISAKSLISSGHAKSLVDILVNEVTAAETSTAEPEDLAKIGKALDDKYNKEPLTEAAKEAGVEFPFDAKKAEIIQAVIDQGKAQALLDKQ